MGKRHDKRQGMLNGMFLAWDEMLKNRSEEWKELFQYLNPAETYVVNLMRLELLTYAPDLKNKRETLALYAILIALNCELAGKGVGLPPELERLHALALARLEQMGLLRHPDDPRFFKKQWDRLTNGLGERLEHVGGVTEFDCPSRGRPLDLLTIIRRWLARRAWMNWAVLGYPHKADVIAREVGSQLGFGRRQMLKLMPTVVKADIRIPDAN